MWLICVGGTLVGCNLLWWVALVTDLRRSMKKVSWDTLLTTGDEIEIQECVFRHTREENLHCYDLIHFLAVQNGHLYHIVHTPFDKIKSEDENTSFGYPTIKMAMADIMIQLGLSFVRGFEKVKVLEPI